MKKFFVCLFLFSLIKVGIAQDGFTDLVQSTEKAVVTVSTFSSDGSPLKYGTAFFVETSGILLSNCHVFENFSEAKIICANKKEYEIDKIISSDKELDLIKFSIFNPANERFPIIEKAQAPPMKGEDIFVIGSPKGLESSVSKGIVSGIREVPNLGKLFQITAPISSGSSGSPVLNMKGKVIGIAVLQLQEGQNLNFAIDISLADRLKERPYTLHSTDKNEDELPKDKEEAKEAIDYSFFQCDTNIINLARKYIAQFPNDYYGYFVRAIVYSCWDLPSSIGINYLTEEYNQKRIEFLIASDRNFTKALLLSSNKEIIYWYRGKAKYVNLMNENHVSTKLIGWDYKGAIDDFNKSIGLDKNVDMFFDKSRFEYMGDLKEKMKDYKGALMAYKQAINSYPERPQMYQLYGKCARLLYYTELNDLIQALEMIEIAYRLIETSTEFVNLRYPDKNFWELFNDWGLFTLYSSIEYEVGNYSKALSAINTLINDCKCACDAYNHYLRALIIYKMQGDNYEIISSLNKAISYEVNNNNKSLYYDLRSKVYYFTQQYQLALIDRNKYFELTPSEELTSIDWYNRSMIKEKLNDLVGALIDINKAIEIDCQDDVNYYQKGHILVSMSDNFGAIQAFDKAIQLNPNEPHYYISRGFTKYDQNKIGACADWSKAGEMGDYSAYDLISKYCK